MNEDGYVNISANELKNYLKSDNINELLESNIDTSGYYRHFKNLNIIGTIAFEDDFESGYDIRIHNCIFQNNIQFNKCTFNRNVWFIDCTFINTITIYNGDFKEFFWLTTCVLKKGISIFNGHFFSFHLDSNSLEKPALIKGGIFSKINFESNNDKDQFQITGRFIAIKELKVNSLNSISLIIKDGLVNKFELKGILNSSSIIIIDNILNHTLSFDGVVNLGKIFLFNIIVCSKRKQIVDKPINVLKPQKIDSFNRDYERFIRDYNTKTVLELVNNFYANKKMLLKLDTYFHQILFEDLIEEENWKNPENISSTFSIVNSSIGHLEMNCLKIEKYDNLLIDGSDLSSIKTLNSKFPIQKNKIRANQDIYLNLYNVYNDLYTSSNKQNNLKDKIEYYKASQQNLHSYTKTEKFSFSNISSLISIWISKVYSDYGQNWIKAFITIILFGLIFYSLFIISLQNITVDFTMEGLIYFTSELLPQFPQFLNPTHNLNFLENKKLLLGNWSATIDLLGRVTIGIGIFETIRSFRKYVRTS